MKKIWLLLAPLFAFADDAAWFTGTLLTEGGVAIKAGHFDIEPYIFFDNSMGYFNNHWQMHRFHEARANVNFQVKTWIGVTDRMDVFINPQAFYNYEGNVGAWRVGDFGVGFDFQLIPMEINSLRPAVKFAFREHFPLGTYQNLAAGQLGTDASGGGSFVTRIGLDTEHLWRVLCDRYFRFRINLFYEFFTPVEVGGINAYGGDPFTNGTVYPGEAVHLILGYEYNFTRHWALALDMVGIYTLATHFEGRTIAPVGNNLNSYQFSLAPAIEYNHNKNVGLIGGVWFTLFGKHTFDFYNGVIALNVYM